MTTTHTIGTAEEHLRARLELLAAEKDLTRRGDEVARRRRELPWARVDDEYVFDTAEGERTLAELFGERSQLLVYHFMFGPDWDAGCPVCSFWADNFNDTIVHLNQRDVTMVCASRAPIAKLEAYKLRMGWTFPWVSSGRNNFNYDYAVSLAGAPAGSSQRDMPRGPALPPSDGVRYNFTKDPFAAEMPGLSAFALEGGVVYHTYSCYARGLDAFNAANQLLDRAPKGRDEDGLQAPAAWIRRHDEYDLAAG
jgi:predicted dithiol-disulfide oxidoreductase (DUF899 family)